MYLLLIQKHHHFEKKNIIDNNLFILIQDLESFAVDDIILDWSRKRQIRT